MIDIFLTRDSLFDINFFKTNKISTLFFKDFKTEHYLETQMEQFQTPFDFDTSEKTALPLKSHFQKFNVPAYFYEMSEPRGLTIHLDMHMTPCGHIQINYLELVRLVKALTKRLISRIEETPEYQLNSPRKLSIWRWKPHLTNSNFIRLVDEDNRDVQWTARQIPEVLMRMEQKLINDLAERNKYGQQMIHFGVKDDETEIIFEMYHNTPPLKNVMEKMGWSIHDDSTSLTLMSSQAIYKHPQVNVGNTLKLIKGEEDWLAATAVNKLTYRLPKHVAESDQERPEQREKAEQGERPKN